MSQELNRSAAIRALGVTRKEFDMWIGEGMPFVDNGSPQKHRYVIAEIFDWHRKHTAKQFAGSGRVEQFTMSAAEAKRRKEVANALSAELNLAKEREQLVVIDDLMRQFTEALTTVRAGLVSMPSRLAGSLSHKSDSEISEELEHEVKDLLEHLSEYNHKYV